MSYGDVPDGAPLRCRMGKHIGQEKGGLMAFQCQRCGGTFPQTDPRYRQAMDTMRLAEASGDRSRVHDVAQAGTAEDMLREVRKT